MAGWYFSEIGISANQDDINLKRQLMKCMGLNKVYDWKSDYDEERYDVAGYEADILYDKEDMIFGEYVPEFGFIEENEMDKMFAMLNMLFPGTYLHVQNYSGHSASCERWLENFLFDPEKMKLQKKAWGEEYAEYMRDDKPSYCKGCYITFDEDMDDYIEIEPEDFEAYKAEHDTNEEYFTFSWAGNKKTSYKYSKPDKTYIQIIIDKSVENGYTELTALILDRYKDILS